MQHARAHDVRRVTDAAGDERRGRPLSSAGRPRVCPLALGASTRRSAATAPVERLPFRQLAVGDRASAAGDAAVARRERRAIDLPARGRLVDQHLARGRRRLASCGAIRGVVCDPNVPASNGIRSVSAITIVIDVERHAQLVGDGLRERRADVLADLGLAGVA